MDSQYKELKKEAILLRNSGCTYGEIKQKLKKDISKSTLSYWCKDIILSKEHQIRIQNNIKNNINKAREKALLVNKLKRENYIESINNRVKHLKPLIKNKDIAKIALGMLYLGEGSKQTSGSLTFCNSDPKIIQLFLNLFRQCYVIDENKFRCTVQCRADQNIIKLERFWSKITKISLKQFYKARIDSRTIGKISKNKDYKGVCRIDYFSGDLFLELIKIIENICEDGPVA